VHHNASRIDSQKVAIGSTIACVTAHDELLTTDEAADWLKLPAAQLKQLRYRGVGPPYTRLGRHIRYARSDLQRWIQAGRVEPQGAA
jgi:Helix-turn-helix domain